MRFVFLYLLTFFVLTTGARAEGGILDSLLGGSPEAEAASKASEPGARAVARDPALAGLPPGVTISDIAERVVESVVNVSSQKVVQLPGSQPNPGPFFNDPFFRHFFGPDQGAPSIPRERRESSLGSGVVVSDDGIVLTNNHVIENAEEIRITLSDGRVFEAEILGTDPQSDVGVLRMLAPPEDLVPLEFGDSDALRLGSTVLAVGNPFGVGQTVTMGIVSAMGRANVGIVDYEDFIQTDAAINPGNSGGALVDLSGALVGINTAILSRSGGYQGVGFAIPSNMAKGIMQSLVDHGKVMRGWLGVMIQDLTPDLARAFDLPQGTSGALVADVVEGSPADEGGLKRGDLVLGMNGEEIASSAKLRNAVANAGAKAEVTFDVMRDGKRKSITLKLGEREGEEVASAEAESGSTLGGLTLTPLTDEIAQQLEIPGNTEGIVVSGVEPGSPASRSGFRRGDVILEANHEKVTSVRDFEKIFEEVDEGFAVLVQRGKGRLFLAFRTGGNDQ